MSPASMNGNTPKKGLTNGNHANGHTPNDSTVSGASSATSEEHVQQFWNRFEATKNNDLIKNSLLEDVLTRHDYLMRKHEEYVKEHKQERELAQEALDREKHWYRQAMHLQRILNRDPYVLVLVDGDGMIFQENLLKQGEIGGKQAATLLHTAVYDWALAEITECPEDVKIVVRVYANLKGLADVCVRSGLVPIPDLIEEFARGFTRSKTMFDFIDVGAGKDRADAKISETFKLYLYDYHCRQVLFGCSHDNGYARLLEQYLDETEIHPRLTMLEGVPFEKELQALPFRTKKFLGIFRDLKIVVPGQLDHLTGPRARNDSRIALNASTVPFTPRTGTPASVYTPFGDISNVNGRSTGSSSPSIPHAATTWSTIATKNAHKPLEDLSRPPVTPVAEPEIQRNKKGQRLDRDLDYDRDEFQRIKKLKSCNQHYIGGGCCHFLAGKEDKCPHNHRYKFNPAELKTLRVVARETPCKRGHECDDPKCIYGHSCPFLQATEGSMRGVGCLNGELCRFPKSMHNMDTVPVKLVKVSGIF